MRNMGSRLSQAALKLAFASSCAWTLGCAKQYVLVEYAERPSLPPSVVEAELKPSAVRVATGRTAVVGFLYPEHCHFADVAEDASPCGVWSRELTRAFVEGGYRVLPVADVAHAYRQTSTPIEAAKQLGAEVLVSISKVDASFADERIAEASFYRSNARGERLESFTPDLELQRWAIEYLGRRSGRDGVDQVLAAFEAVATHIPSGTVMWSFRGSKLVPTQPYMNASLLLRGCDDAFRPVLPAAEDVLVLPSAFELSSGQALEHGIAMLTVEAFASFQESHVP